MVTGMHPARVAICSLLPGSSNKRGEEEKRRKAGGGVKGGNKKATSVHGTGGACLPGDCNLRAVLVFFPQFRPHDILQR